MKKNSGKFDFRHRAYSQLILGQMSSRDLSYRSALRHPVQEVQDIPYSPNCRVTLVPFIRFGKGKVLQVVGCQSYGPFWVPTMLRLLKFGVPNKGP